MYANFEGDKVILTCISNREREVLAALAGGELRLLADPDREKRELGRVNLRHDSHSMYVLSKFGPAAEKAGPAADTRGQPGEQGRRNVK